MNPVLIIGAGPAGVSCAYALTKVGLDVRVCEASRAVGGMARSLDLFGQRVDCGPHRFFSRDPRVNAYFEEVVGDAFTIVDRLTRIYYRGGFFDYPLRPGDVLAQFSPTEIARIVGSYLARRIAPAADVGSFEGWVRNQFGDELYHLFFKSYTEKLWGIPCGRIDARWAAQRIRGFSLWEGVKSAVWKPAGRKHKTLVERFAYPHGGAGTLHERAVDRIRAWGGTVELEAPVRRVLLDADGRRARGVELADGRTFDADVVVSTMPLPQMLRGLPAVPEAVLDAASRLYFRNTLLVYLEVDSDALFRDNWIYVQSDSVRHGRITNFRNWSPTLYGDATTSILCLEYWCFDDDALWTEDAEVSTERAEREVRRLGLVPDSIPVLNHHVLRIPRCYPVYEKGYEAHLGVVERYLSKIEGLIPIGRYGAFKYNNQDHSILMGLLAADNIVAAPGARPINLWDVNTDVDYQESGHALPTTSS